MDRTPPAAPAGGSHFGIAAPRVAAVSELVSIGVPVFRGTEFVGEALKSILAQTYRNLDVLISVDGGDEESAEACRRHVRGDSRFTLVVQKDRLGWAGNISFLMGRNRGDYWYFHQQDDLVTPDYVHLLLEHARKHPDASVVYSDLKAFGTLDLVMHQDSVIGSPAAREVSLLKDHLAAVAFRGLTRAGPLAEAHGIRQNEIESFAAETTWMASVARAGTLRRLPQLLYFKRFHGNNLHTKWLAWPLDKRKSGWQVHCRDMFLEAAEAEATTEDRRAMWSATIGRLVSRLAAHYLPVDAFDAAERRAYLDGFLRSFGPRAGEVETALDLSWAEIEEASYAAFATTRGGV